MSFLPLRILCQDISPQTHFFNILRANFALLMQYPDILRIQVSAVLRHLENNVHCKAKPSQQLESRTCK